MKEYVYSPKGVCSSKFIFQIEEDKIVDVEILNGCAGNLLGISNLLKGMSIDEVIEKFSGVPCGRKNTSCPDQIAQALVAYKE